MNVQANLVTPNTTGAPTPANCFALHTTTNTNVALSTSTITPGGAGPTNQAPFSISGSIYNPASTPNTISIHMNTASGTGVGAVHVYEGSECHSWQQSD
jgi:hypothetical protein